MRHRAVGAGFLRVVPTPLTGPPGYLERKQYPYEIHTACLLLISPLPPLGKTRCQLGAIRELSLVLVMKQMVIVFVLIWLQLLQTKHFSPLRNQSLRGKLPRIHLSLGYARNLAATNVGRKRQNSSFSL